MKSSKVSATGMALAITLTLLNLVCLVLLLIAPEFSLSLFGYFIHGLDLSKVAIIPKLNISTLVGIAVTFIGGYLLGLIFERVHMRFKKQ